MPKPKTIYIPSFSSEFQEKFIKYLMWQGKKSIARKVFQNTLNLLKERGHKEPLKLLEKAVDNIKPNLEIKSKRIGGSVYQIPIEVKPRRQLILAFRWLINGARDKKGAEMGKKLAEEIELASNNQGSAIKKREDTHKMAKANKAFAHFARY